MAKKIDVSEIQKRIKTAHGNTVWMDASTYKGTHKKARFIDIDCGEWWAIPSNVIHLKSSHPLRTNEKRIKTNMKRFGVPNPFQSKDVKNKILNTNMNLYGVYNPSQNIEIKAKKKITSLKNYGVENPNQSAVIKEKKKRTFLKNLGVDNPAKDPIIALKFAKSSNNSSIRVHWKTGKELICQGGYESKIVDYLNTNQIYFEWQPRVFTMPSGKTYRPDFYLINEDKWIEIKGYFRKDAQEKWDWFQSIMPNSELWNRKTLKDKGIYVK